MIEYINKRLNEWASWCKRRDDGGLGYPSQSNYCSAVQIRGTASAGAITQFAAEEEIEVAMTRIRKTSPVQWDVAGWIYLKGSFPMRRIAQELRCDEATVYRRLHALHLAVMDVLADLDIEAQERQEAWHAAGAIASATKHLAVVAPVVIRKIVKQTAEFA